MITLDTDLLRAWLQDQVRRGMADDGSVDVEIPASWEPRLSHHDDNGVGELVWNAIKLSNAVEGHDGVDILFVYEDDGDGGAYMWMTDVVRNGKTLRLASHSEGMDRIGSPDLVGIDAAVDIVAEAVAVANKLVSDLDAFVAANKEAYNP